MDKINQTNRKLYRVSNAHYDIHIAISPRNPNYVPSKDDFKKAICAALKRYSFNVKLKSTLFHEFLREFLKLTKKEMSNQLA